MTADSLTIASHTTRMAGHRHTRQLTHQGRTSSSTSSRSAYRLHGQHPATGPDEQDQLLHPPPAGPAPAAPRPCLSPCSHHELGAPLTASTACGQRRALTVSSFPPCFLPFFPSPFLSFPWQRFLQGQHPTPAPITSPQSTLGTGSSSAGTAKKTNI